MSAETLTLVQQPTQAPPEGDVWEQLRRAYGEFKAVSDPPRPPELTLLRGGRDEEERDDG